MLPLSCTNIQPSIYSTIIEGCCDTVDGLRSDGYTVLAWTEYHLFIVLYELALCPCLRTNVRKSAYIIAWRTCCIEYPQLLLLIHIFSILSLQLKKIRWHNKSAIDLSNANPACGLKGVRRSTGHIMVTTRYSDQQGSKSRQKVMRLYKQLHRPMPKRLSKSPYSILSRATSID